MQNFETLLGFARMRDVAIRQTHLPHLCFSNFQTRIIRKWIGWEERQPVLISLRCLDQCARGPFEEERIGDRKFREWEKRRIGIGVDDRCEKQTARIVMAFADLFCRLFKKHAIATRDCGAGQISVFVVATAE